MAEKDEAYPQFVDISNCEIEPIHIIGHTQSHGVLLACDPLDFLITQAGGNCANFFGRDPEQLLGRPLTEILEVGTVEELKEECGRKDFIPKEINLGDRSFLLLPHLSGENLILDFEPLGDSANSTSFELQLGRVMSSLERAGSVEDLCNQAARFTREFFDYDRVMIYTFDEEWNGKVIAEEKQEDMESWLGLHYPASDIPAQSRHLFFKHRIRIISDVEYRPVRIIPEISPVDKKPLDLSQSHLRAVSPIHIEYLQNMGVGASLTAAIIVNDELWGLLACHHNLAKFLNYYQRESCRFLARTLANEITLRESNRYLEKTKEAENVQKALIGQLRTHRDLQDALCLESPKFTDLIACSGGALVRKDQITFTGNTPSKEEVKVLMQDLLSTQKEKIFTSRSLSNVFSAAEVYKRSASGILSLRLSEDVFLIWFRSELPETVTWGGNPEEKIILNEKEQRLSPRKSFEKWSEKVTGRAAPWQDYELNAVSLLGESIRFFLLEEQSGEIKDLNTRLMEVNKELELFSYGLSHDLRAPVRGIRGYLQVLREDYEEMIGNDGSLLMDKAHGLTDRMDILIEDILTYARLSSGEIKKEMVDLNKMLPQVLEIFNLPQNFSNTRIKIQKDLPPQKGDRRMLFQLWTNLISNALKYSAEKEQPVVEIGVQEKNIFYVKDNGIGFEPKFSEKIFDTFSRVAGGKFEGTGIGLAIVKRIIEKHEGHIRAEGSPDKGAAFYFRLSN